VVIAALVPLFAASSCGGEGPDAGDTPVVKVKERDFRISAPKRIPAGEVVLAVDNKGPDDHELVVIREEESAEAESAHGAREEEEGKPDTPLRADGLTVDEDALGSAVIDELEADEPGVRHLRIALKPGRYEFICNMAGHYLGGMETDVTVQ
jgi:uncharacterized cupredoxin-like copper-binding protein